MNAARAIDWVLLDPTAPDAVHVGDVVSREAGGMPIFRVVAMDGAVVWLGGEREQTARPMPLQAFRWLGHPAEARASA